MAAKPKDSITENFEFGPWKITSVKGHILQSEGLQREMFEKELRLPQVPEMIFADNVLRLQYNDSFTLEFTALDSLKLVDAEHDIMKVAVANAWREARADCEHINDVVKPFDWTFTTDYRGSVKCAGEAGMKVNETTQRIDLEKLKVRERIHFYADVLLFEDELADNGSAILSVKIRVMPSSFFILMRFYLRVDELLIRQNDTRLYHQAGTDFLLREYSSKEKQIKDLRVPPHVLTDQNEISSHLDLKCEKIEKIFLPTSSSSPGSLSDTCIQDSSITASGDQTSPTQSAAS